MENKEIIIGSVVGLLVLGLVVYVGHWFMTHPCKQSHMEIQYKAPPSVVVGGGKNGGGVAVPIGNMRPVQVEVCDER